MRTPCFYQLLGCSNGSFYELYFANNSATNGGDDIYGASFQLPCQNLKSGSDSCELSVIGHSSSFSSVSSTPNRVCFCDSTGNPQCDKLMINCKYYPGEQFTISAVIVGGDFGTTIGTVHANFMIVLRGANPQDSWLRLKSTAQYSQTISNGTHCSELTFTLIGNDTRPYNMMYLTAQHLDPASAYSYLLTEFTDVYNFECDFCKYTSPVFINITLALPCPPGFTLVGDPPRCDCFPVLTNNAVQCKSSNGTGYFLWNNEVWISVSNNAHVEYGKYGCPFDYCIKGGKLINTMNDLNAQCSFNRAGRLCGGCEDNYSLAIGSSHCIHCPNNNNLALLIFFAAAGVLLVLLIGALNLTVTQGIINGLIFYANVIWTYQSVFFSQETAVMSFLKMFIAWLNLDFGIKACFISRLTAPWNAVLQYIFPLYICIIAGVIIAAARYSSRLTNLLGNRAVPLLATLFLLSYTKFLNNSVSSLDLSIIYEYSNVSLSPVRSIVVWSVDANYDYFGWPHVLLFLLALVSIVFLLVVCILPLLLMQWLRRVSHLKLLKWTTKLHPFYDACFAPLKPKHHYLFGILLLIRGIMQVMFTSTFASPPYTNLLLLLVIGVLLLVYMAYTHPYKSKILLLLQMSFLMNLTLLSGFFIFASTQSNTLTLQSVCVGLSAGIVFIQFCGIMLYAIISPRCSKTCESWQSVSYHDLSSSIERPQAGRQHLSYGYRDSIMNESQLLVPTY